MNGSSHPASAAAGPPADRRRPRTRRPRARCPLALALAVAVPLQALAPALIRRPAEAAWTQKTFVIGTWWDPCQSYNQPPAPWNAARVNDDLRRALTAVDAHFNLFTGTQLARWINHTPDGMKYALQIVAMVDSLRPGAHLEYLVSDGRASDTVPPGHQVPPCCNDSVPLFYSTGGGLTANQSAAMAGYRLDDEPSRANARNIKDWIQFLKRRSPGRLVFIDVTAAVPDEYLDAMISDPLAERRPDVLAYDLYPIMSDGSVYSSYFRLLAKMSQRAQGRPLWAFPMSTHFQGHVDPQEQHMRFTAFCAIAYGATGLVWFTYDLALPDFAGYVSAPVVNCDTLTDKYYAVKRINHYLERVLGPVVMASRNLGVWHASSDPTREALPADALFHGNNVPVIASLSNANAMAAVYRHRKVPSTYYLLVVNKSFSPQTVRVWLKGDDRGAVTLAPSVYRYSGSMAYSAPSPLNYDPGTHRTDFSLNLQGGEGRLVKVTGITDPRIGARMRGGEGAIGDRVARLATRTR